MESLLRFLIPELANMVLEYCWENENDNFEEACTYGDYEGMLLLHNKKSKNIIYMLYCSGQGGYIKLINYNMNQFPYMCSYPGS